MSTTARIEELRKKFDENPRRYFAPLANELRKAGELKQAIALCREHLPKQPGHMSGYIVFGQALFEVGELDEARDVFEQALALDPENLIALHHLGHIARQQGDTAAARRWYERALETDPRNDDIAHQLAALVTPVRPHSAVPTPASPAAVDPARDIPLPDAGIVAPRRDLGAIPTPPASQPAIGAIPTPPDAQPAIGAIPTPPDAQPAIGDRITPPMAQESIGAIPVAPTPDAAMRAVDFDLVNPAGSNADEDTPAPAPEPADAVTESNEPIDLVFDEPVGGDLVSDDAIALTVEIVSTTGDASGPIPDDDPFEFADETSATAALHDTGATAPVDLDAAFEEGLVTAGWPAPSDLEAVSTPRAVTPLNVEVTPDAVEAFGREAADPVVLPIPEPEIDILGDEADLAPLTPATPVSLIVEEEAATPVAAPGAELPWPPAPDTPTEDVVAIVQPSGGVPADAVDAPAPRSEGEAEDESTIGASATFAAAVAEPEPLAGDGAGDTVEPSTQSPAFVTETMGELLVAQGFTDRAVVVYEELVRRRPYDPLLSARLAELREQLETATPVRVYTARERLAALAARRVVRRTPVRPYTPISSTAIASRAATPVASAAIAAEDSLAALFGAEAQTQDDFAAQALADAFAPLPMESTPAPDAFVNTFLGVPDGPRTPTPAYGAVRQPTPVAMPPIPPASDDEGPAFSFDRFFPDPAARSGTPATGASHVAPQDAPAAGEASPSEDLAQFSAWLKGLGQS